MEEKWERIVAVHCGCRVWSMGLSRRRYWPNRTLTELIISSYQLTMVVLVQLLLCLFM